MTKKTPKTRLDQLLVSRGIASTIKDAQALIMAGSVLVNDAPLHKPIDVRAKTCMDIGSSTGGFTDCLLQHGARKVYAVDVGKNLMDYRLRKNPDVELLEGVNFRYFSLQNLKEPVEFVTIDVSFISLAMILPLAAQCVAPGGEILALIKPQFEGLPHELRKGVVKDEEIRLKIIEKCISSFSSLDCIIKGEMDSPVKGPCGNIERFLWLKKK